MVLRFVVTLCAVVLAAAAQGADLPAPGESFKDCDDCPEMVVLPAGSFQMGSPVGERNRAESEGPVRRVTIERAFSVGKFEVTKAEYAAFVAESGYAGGDSCWTVEVEIWDHRSGRSWRIPAYRQTDRDPAVCISWNDARAYTQWLSRKTGKAYRLLSEAEWEYAARAGTTGPRYWGADIDMGCRYANSADQTALGDPAANGDFTASTVAACHDGNVHTAPVGRFQANAFGLHDMLGNAWEWTADCWNDSYVGAPSDGSAWTRGRCEDRVLRGGSWHSMLWYIRSAGRIGHVSGDRNYDNGFRVARTD